MKIETILDAMADALYQRRYYGHISVDLDMSSKRHRQYNAFRARILRMDADKDELIDLYVKSVQFMGRHASGYREQLAAKDAKIAELEKYIDTYNCKILAEDVEALKQI